MKTSLYTSIRITAFLSCWLSAGAVNTTNVKSVGATGASLSLAHPLPTITSIPPETFAASGWLVSILPAGYETVDSSKTGVVLLKKRDAYYTELFSYWRWSSGKMERLEKTSYTVSTYHSGVYLNDLGEIATVSHYPGLNPPDSPFAYSIVKVWSPSAKSFDFLWKCPLVVRHWFGGEMMDEPHDAGFAIAELVGLDNYGKMWVMIKDPDVSWRLETIDRNGQAQRQFPGSVGPDSFRMSKGGHWYSNADPYSLTSIIDGVEEPNFAPTSININGIALDTYGSFSIIRYPDGTIEEGPNGQNPNWNVTWIDDEDRLMGRRLDETGKAIPCFFKKKKDSNGALVSPVEYEYVDFVPLALANGWTTDHMIAPDAISPQLGIAKRTLSDGTVEERAFLALRAPQLAVDADRDGTINLATEDASDATSAEKPYRFWLNDDDDSGDTEGSDIPSGTNYYTNDITGVGVVRGTRDLIDLFPVYLDIKQLLTALPPSVSVKYKLKQADSAVNFVYTNLTRDHAFDYQRPPVNTAPLNTGFGIHLGDAPQEASKIQITAEGFDIFRDGFGGSPDFLDAILNHNGGVILVEGRSATDKPLVLSVEKTDGTVLAEIKLELKLSPVEQMFRHLNLRNGPDAPSGLIGQTGNGHAAIPTQMNECSAFPDETGDAKWLIFVHGYNVSGEKARGWTTEMFKRFYWSHNKARFVGVTWFGNPGTGNNNIVQGYHWAVRNAVPSAQALAAKINALPGGKTVIGHSQGCWLTASAVADYGLSISNLCLVDAAFAQECLEGDVATDTTNMVPAEWQAYPSGTWSANWYRHFTDGGLPSSDARSTLTWNSRLASALDQTAVSSFYSSTEDVLATYPGTIPAAVVENAFNAVADWDLSKLGRYAWVSQEKTKGSKVLLTQGSDYGGWGPNLTDRPDGSSDPIYYWVNGAGGRFLFSPNELPQLDVAMVRRAPIFDPGYSPKSGAFHNYDPSVLRGPSWIQQLYDSTSDTTSGGAIAAAHRTELLAEAFPALSLPVGANETPRLQTNNYNMPVQFASLATWPRGPKDSTGIADWHHSDIRAVAYIFQYRLFDKLITLSNQ